MTVCPTSERGERFSVTPIAIDAMSQPSEVVMADINPADQAVGSLPGFPLDLGERAVTDGRRRDGTDGLAAVLGKSPSHHHLSKFSSVRVAPQWPGTDDTHV